MKILEINKFYNAKRGADKHFLDVIELLKYKGHQVADFSMIQRGNEHSAWEKYFLSTVGYGKNFSLWEKIKGAGRMFYSLEAKRKINALLDEFDPDIVHIHNIYHQMSPAILFEIKKRGLPIVMTVHDFKLINPNYSLRLGGKAYLRCANGKYYQCFLDKAVKSSYLFSLLAALEMYWHRLLGTYEKNVDLYIAPSEFTKKILIHWGMDEKKILVLPHFTPGSANEIAGRCAFPVDDRFALYAGKISKEKGVDTLIEIFKNQKKLKLYLAGETEPGFEIPANSNIVHLGFVEAPELSEYMRASQCVISGSLLPETFGLVALEAINIGKPFFGFDAGAYGEIIENGISGAIAKNKMQLAQYVAEIADGKLAFDENLIRAQAAKYNAKLYGEKIEEIFSDLVAKRGQKTTRKNTIDKD